MRKFWCLIIFSLFFGTLANAMSTPPSIPTIEAENVRIEYIDQIGFAGAGEKQFFYPSALDVTTYGDISTAIGNSTLFINCPMKIVLTKKIYITSSLEKFNNFYISF